MRELLCPACSCANAVKDRAAMHAVRCAQCEGPLDEQRHVRYLVDEAGLVKGPRILRDLVQGAATGELTGDMRLSEEGRPWFLAEERDDIFRTRPARHAAPQEAVRIPAPVLWMANLAGILGAFLVLGGVLVGVFLGELAGRSDAATALLVLFALGLGHLWMSFALRRGSQAARVLQLGLAALAALGVLSGAAQGMDVRFTLVALGFVSVPFFLLLNKEARAYFRDA